MSDWTLLFAILGLIAGCLGVLALIADHRVTDEAVDAWLRNHRGFRL